MDGVKPIKPSLPQLKAVRAAEHAQCVVCSSHNPLGLGIEFILADDGSIQGYFSGSHIFTGYPGLLHGGVIAALLDGAMTNCLFAHGLVAVTAELKVRYRHPVKADKPVVIRAWTQKSLPPLHLLQAELQQNGRIKATATAKFMERQEL
jgi:uncharacterized protein (TIGR00369 family)